jgi:hypothetical protein
MACVLSGLAGVYFEKILKNSKVSIWVRNIQLGMFGTFFALITCWLSDYDSIKEHGFFFGYTHLVWANILIQSAGGLLVAVVIKYADNILKGFATSIAIVVSCLASTYFFNTDINGMFMFGTLLVISSVFLYSYTPAQPSLLPTSSSQSQSNSPKHSLENANLLYNSSSGSDDIVKYKLEMNGGSSGKGSISLDMKPI